MSNLKKWFHRFFPENEISNDFSKEELKILKDVGFKVFTQKEIKKMIEVKNRTREIENMNPELILAS